MSVGKQSYHSYKIFLVKKAYLYKKAKYQEFKKQIPTVFFF